MKVAVVSVSLSIFFTLVAFVVLLIGEDMEATLMDLDY